jgi:hypothetical protein
MKKYFSILIIFVVASFLLAFTQHNTNQNIGGIGGLATFDSIKKRPIIKALEYNAYISANKLRPGDLILEIDKVPIHEMSYGEVLKLVLGKVGTPMSLKVIRYNGIEHYYEINRIRVTLDMNPKWWQIPEYKYYGFNQAIETAIKDISSNGGISLDRTIDPIIPDTKFHSTIMLKEAYESIFIKENNKYTWVCNLMQSEDKEKVEGLYAMFAAKLSGIKLNNTVLEKKFDNSENSKKVFLQVKETIMAQYNGLVISVNLKKEFNKEENKELWRVFLEVRK